MAGIALIVCAVASVMNGTAPAIGAGTRLVLRPYLQGIRDRSGRSRQELADLSMLLGVVLALASLSVSGLIVAGLLVSARPAVARLASDENELTARVTFMMTDAIVGIYVPLVLAMLMFGEVALSCCLASVTVALSWPIRGFGTSRWIRPIAVPIR